MLGYSVDYDSKMDDDNLLHIAKEQDVILLTRDEQLYNRAKARKVSAFLVVGEKEEERLGQLARVLGISLNIDMAETKCPQCGSPLREAAKEEVSDSVPEASLRLYEQFWKCANLQCRKVYWVGSHWKQIHHTLQEAQRIASIRE